MSCDHGRDVLEPLIGELMDRLQGKVCPRCAALTLTLTALQLVLDGYPAKDHDFEVEALRAFLADLHAEFKQQRPTLQ